ncbi:MAG: hypothetical protein K0S14_1621 [Thermomicrobiales bacterium]|jgi:hypothetical protein|nr:hypothetical protein [Thermomicrobiales bacterium]MCD6058538.1 hypothetical protein [Thermomicrobiales bacterium]
MAGPEVAHPEAPCLHPHRRCPRLYHPPPLDGYRPHILAINNDPAVLALFRDLLEEAGYQVSTQNYVDRDLAQPA